MIGHQLALIKREIWEHRSIYVTPIAIAVIVSLVSLAGMVTVSAFDKEVNIALFGASNIAGDAERRAALTVFFLGTSWVFLFALAILHHVLQRSIHCMPSARTRASCSGARYRLPMLKPSFRNC